MHPGDGRVVSSFIVQALKNEPLTINGEGNQTRSFCYVDDLIKGFVSFMESDNLGNPNEFTILELAKTVIEMTGLNSELIFLPLPSDDPKQRQPDISLARLGLGWEPKKFLI